MTRSAVVGVDMRFALGTPCCPFVTPQKRLGPDVNRTKNAIRCEPPRSIPWLIRNFAGICLILSAIRPHYAFRARHRGLKISVNSAGPEMRGVLRGKSLAR